MVIGQKERRTLERVAALFQYDLGYKHLGIWSDRTGNTNIEPDILGGKER